MWFHEVAKVDYVTLPPRDNYGIGPNPMPWADIDAFGKSSHKACVLRDGW